MTMPRRVLFFIIILCIFAPFLSADERDKFEYVAGTGIEIHTNPQGARVFINGIERGVTPFFTNDLPAETYKIILRKETYADREFEAVIFNNSRLVVSMEIEIALGYVDISVHKESGSPALLPFHPQISANAPDKTITSISLSNNNTASTRLPIGNQTLQARAFGWEDSSVTVLVSGQKTTTAEIIMKPAVFKMAKATQSRKRFNPLNSSNLGVTEYRFEVTAPGIGTIKIYDSSDNIVYERNLEQFSTWIQELTWNGTDNEGNLLPQGDYSVVIEASPLPQFTRDEETEISSLKLKTEINYSINIFPLSLESGFAGLSFTPMPHTLPAGSFQVNSNILFAKDETYGIGFPFKLNFRVAPIEHFELSAGFNINPYIEHKIGWGISASAKYNFFDGTGSAPIAFSIGSNFAWASGTDREATGEHMLSPGKGAGFFTPLSFELKDFSIIFCPAAFWHGFEGIIPELLLSAGVLYRSSWLNTGISARYEFDFEENNNSRFLTGAELNLFPPPSNVTYSIQGGVILKNSGLGFYAGIGIGLIY